MTDRKAFEDWIKSVHLDAVTKTADAWGEVGYLPHVNSMWFGWQASRKRALEEAAKLIYEEVQYDHGFNFANKYAEQIRNMK